MFAQNLLKHQQGLFDKGIAGNACAITVDGKNVYEAYVGWADIAEKRPIRPDTIYQMYSLTKVLTGAALMQLFENGHFLLSDPLSNYLPEFARMGVKKKRADGTYDIVEAQRPIRLEDLFTMSAGFDYDVKRPAVAELFNGPSTFDARDFARALAREPLVFEPGTHYVYGLEYDVLGGLLQEITGERLESYCARRIFEPLEMADSWFHVPASEFARYATKYVFDVGQRPFKAIPFVNDYQPGPNFDSGGAGLSCTLADYARFATALARGGKGANGARILGNGTVRMMAGNRLNDDTRLRDFRGEFPTGYGWGLCGRAMLDDGPSYAPCGPGEFGWSGACGAYAHIDLSRRAAMVYAQEMWPGDPIANRPRVRNIACRVIDEAINDGAPAFIYGK